MNNSVIKDIPCKDWHTFIIKHERLLEGFTDYIFRGQYNANWPLNTSFQRFLRNSGITISSDSENPFQSLINHYKPHYDRKYKDNNFSIDDYISVGQHYGLPTIYQDWTKRINKAIFFAFCDEIINPQDHESVAVYALRIKHIDKLIDSVPMKELIINKGGIKLFEESGITLIEPNNKLPNERIDQQDGVFLKIDGYINQNFSLLEILNRIYSCYNITKPIIYKFIIPKAEAIYVLKELHNKSSINFSTIYPDKEGFAKQAKFEFILKQE